MEPISAAPRLLVMKTMAAGEIHAAVVAQRQGGLIQDAQQEIPESVASAFSISSNKTKLILIVSVWNWFSVSWLSSGCVSRWPSYPGGEPISLAIS